MRAALVIFALLIAVPAHADHLLRLLIDHEAGQAFGKQLQQSIVIVSVRPQVAQWIDEQFLVERLGAAVAVRDKNGIVRLLTSGPLLEGHSAVHVRSVSGRTSRVARVKTLGDGALAELLDVEPALLSELTPLALAPNDRAVRELPVFSVGNPGGDHPVLVRGIIVKQLEAPLKGLLLSDISAPLGWPLISADKRLIAVNFRPHPKKAGIAIGVSSEMIRAWLHPKDSAKGPRSATD